MIAITLENGIDLSQVKPSCVLAIMIICGIYEKLGAKYLELTAVSDVFFHCGLESVPDDHLEVLEEVIQNTLGNGFTVEQTFGFLRVSCHGL